MDALLALRLQMEWGVDEVLLDHPVDRFLPAQPIPAAPIAHPAAAQGAATAAAARLPTPAPAAIAQGAADLHALHAALDAVDFPLRATASHTVGPAGNPASGLMLVAEAPGPEDDRSGRAFSGPPGDALDRVLASAGLSRNLLTLSFLVPWRPPGGRKPTDNEISFCLPFMHRLLLLTRPRRLVLMSGLALRTLANDPSGVRRARGRWTTVEVPGLDPIPALPMLPPDLWLTSASSRSSTWSDLLAVRIALD